MPKVNNPAYTKRFSPKQEQVLNFILVFQDKHQHTPTLKEIARHLGVTIATVSQHLAALTKKGAVRRVKGKPRSITVNPNLPGFERMRPHFLNIPLLGTANAGTAILTAEEDADGYLKVPRSILGKRANVFALHVEGNSMNKAKISGKNVEDGDFVLIDPEYRTPQNGEYVLSVIDGHANLKKFIRDSKTGQIRLESESTSKKHKPIYLSSEDDFMVNGKIIAVVKK